MAMKLTKKDYIWSYIGVFLSLFGSVVLTPFVVYFLDGERYGLWGVFQSLSAITALFDFGFATTFSRNINYCWNGAKILNKAGNIFSESKEPNFFLMKKTMAACQRVFLIISAVAWIIMVTVGTFYISHISKGFNSSEPIIAWIICTIAIFMNLYFGYYGSFLRGVGAISDVYKATVYAKALQIVLTIILLACGAGIIGTSIAYLSYGTLYRIIARRRFYRYKGIGNGLKSVHDEILTSDIKETFFIVWHNAWREGLVSLANYLSNQSCTIIISLYMPLTQTGAYSLGVHLATAVSQVAAVMYTSNQPVLQSAYVTKDNERMKNTMSLIVFSFVVLDLLGLLAIITVGLPLLRLIRPETVVAPSIMMGIGMYQLILKFRNCYTSYFSCTNRIIYVKAFLISSVACVAFALLSMGVFQMGIWGLIAAQLISQLMYNAWAWTVKAHKEMSLSAKETFCLGYRESFALLRIFLRRGGKQHA